MVNESFRNRALWNGALAIYAVPFSLLTVPLAVISSGVTYSLLVAYFLSFSIVVFLVIDSTILVGREMDFFHRD